MTFFGCNALKCVSMNHEECKIRPKIINVNSNEPLFYSYSIKVNKFSDSCNNINDPYSKLCVPDVVKKINFKVFNLMSRANERRHIEWHETCKCKYRLDSCVCNNKQRWNNDKCRCECEELIDKGMCDKGFIWIPSNCECECGKSCDVGAYSDYKNFQCRNILVDKVVGKCIENIDENELICNGNLNDYGNVCNSCTIFFIISTSISNVFIYFGWESKRRYIETTIY